jgi:hypothetical protein
MIVDPLIDDCWLLYLYSHMFYPQKDSRGVWNIPRRLLRFIIFFGFSNITDVTACWLKLIWLHSISGAL